MVNCNPIDEDYIVSWLSDLENTKESILPVCDKPYHKIKENMPHGEELEKIVELSFKAYSVFVYVQDLKIKTEDITRSTVQKSVCVLSNLVSRFNNGRLFLLTLIC